MQYFECRSKIGNLQFAIRNLMLLPEIETGVRTVTHVARYFDELKASALLLSGEVGVAERGYFVPDEEDAIRGLLISYWQSRSALLELIQSFHFDRDLSEESRPRAFLVALAATLVLVDAARFLREQFHDNRRLRRIWNQPAPNFGIPSGTYDTVQKSLFSARHAWHLYHAQQYFNEHESELCSIANETGLHEIWEIIQRLKQRLDVGVAQFARTKLRVRSDQVARSLGRNVIVRAMYGIQKMVSGMMADVYVRPGHQPALPQPITDQLHGLLAPGDVLIVRKEYALTNYFLPGYWPHAALYLGHPAELALLGIQDHEHVRPRWARLLEASHPERRGVAQPRRVLESMKDGVLLRSLNSPFASDSILVIRPQLTQTQIADGLARALAHEGKPYDFDFNFGRSDRLVCTEVVYRAFDGLGDIEIPLCRRAGRPTLSGGDLVDLALSRVHFDPVLVYAPSFAPEVVQGSGAMEIIRAAHQPPKEVE